MLQGQLTGLLASGDPEFVSMTRRISIIDDFVRDLAADLRFVESALTSRVPWSLIRPLENLLTKYVPGTTLLLRPQWYHNYSVQLEEVGERYRKDLMYAVARRVVHDVFDEFPQSFFIISFPSIERKNALLHCDLAHEIGHLVARQFLAQEKPDYLLEFRKRIPAALDGTESLGPLWQEKALGQLEEASRLRKRALEELISDMFAARALGPASLFALLGIAATQQLDRHPRKTSFLYPPWRTRLRVVATTLRSYRLMPDQHPSTDASVKSRLVDWTGAVERELQPETDWRVLEQDPIVRIAYESARQALPQVDAFLTERFGSQFPDPDNLYQSVYPLTKRLADGVPPNEVTGIRSARPASVEGILNAAWAYRITYLDERPAHVLPAGMPDLRDLNRLTLKAAELSFIQQEYSNWRTNRHR